MDYKHINDKVITERKLSVVKTRLDLEKFTTNDPVKIKELQEQIKELEAHLNFLR